MRIVIIESITGIHRWELQTLPERRTLFDSKGGFRTQRQCMDDLRENIEKWILVVTPMARTPLSDCQVVLGSIEDDARILGTVRDLWPELFEPG